MYTALVCENKWFGETGGSENYFPVHRQPARKKAKRWRDTELQTEFAGPKVENWQQAGITVPMDLRDKLKELNAHERTD